MLVLPAALTEDEELLEVLHEVSAQGYAIALADKSRARPPPSCLEHATFLTLDVSTLERPTLAQRVACLQSYALPLVAQQVQTWDDFQYCRDLGFAFFTARLSASPPSSPASDSRPTIWPSSPARRPPGPPGHGRYSGQLDQPRCGVELPDPAGDQHGRLWPGTSHYLHSASGASPRCHSAHPLDHLNAPHRGAVTSPPSS